MAKSKASATKSSQTKAPSMDSAERPQTTHSPNHGGHPRKEPRRSERLKGLPMPVYNPEPLASTEAMSDETMLSTPVFPHLAIGSNGEPQSSDNDATLAGDAGSDEALGDKQHPGSTSVTRSRKRKAATSAVPPRPTKKQNIDSPISTRQRKAVGNAKYKTVKERFQALSAEDTRPLPWGEPEVWAETRPELCEALPYFRCWEGASYTHDGHVFGMLLDEDRGERAYMDEQIAIARASGGIKQNSSGDYCQGEDHDTDNGRIKAFINNKKDGRPLYLIIGQNNIHCPSKIPHRYCVAGAYHITDIWEEMSNGHTVIKYRMEKTDLKYKSWHAAADSPEVEITDIKALRLACPECDVTKPQVFKSGWMCLNGPCPQFWLMNGARAPEAQEYNPAFLKERSVFVGLLPPYDMIPKLIQPDAKYGRTFPATKECWKGIVCELCGRCNLRRHWDAWRCRTEGCPFEYKIPMDIIPASSVIGDAGSGYQGHGICHDKVLEKSIECDTQKHGLYRECVYKLGDGLTITHHISNNIINSASGGPDDLFCQLQMEDMGLERLPMKQCAVEGTHSRHFSHNFGMPYNYVVGHDNSTSLADAPSGIKEAVRRMTWAAKRIVGDKEFSNFNEVLAIGYLETQKMNYHDDGEASLGPTVVSLSLGSPAKMKWRLKTKYWCGFKDKLRNHYDPLQPIVPGCRKPEVRLKLNEMAKTVTKAELNAAAKKELAFGKGESKTSPVVLEMDLRHGDYMVMHGASMQLYYEHMVVPTDKLRFGLTCRYVKPEMVPEGMRKMGDLVLDPTNAYDGDLKLYEDHMEKYNVGLVPKKRLASAATLA